MASLTIDQGRAPGAGARPGDLAQRGAAWLGEHPQGERVLIGVTVSTLWTGLAFLSGGRV